MIQLFESPSIFEYVEDSVA